jgi:hypothetical protein
MCFSVKIKENEVLIAKRTITCWKVVNPKGRGNYISYWQSFEYENGFHYYNENFPKTKKVRVRNLSGEGIHSYSTLDRAKKNVYSYRSLVIIRCEIPKGASYVKNSEDEEYISSDLIVRGRQRVSINGIRL